MLKGHSWERHTNTRIHNNMSNRTSILGIYILGRCSQRRILTSTQVAWLARPLHLSLCMPYHGASARSAHLASKTKHEHAKRVACGAGRRIDSLQPGSVVYPKLSHDPNRGFLHNRKPPPLNADVRRSSNRPKPTIQTVVAPRPPPPPLPRSPSLFSAG